MDIFRKCFEYTTAKEAIAAGYYPYFIPLAESEGTEVVYQGRRLVMCGSNNYLGLTNHPKVIEAAQDALARFGTSCTGSRFLNGTLEMHEQLERELARYVGKPAALVFSTGMQTNLGTISSLATRADVVILDREDHASIVDGARLGYGRMLRYRHNNVDDLERVLRRVPENAGRLVIVDGVFSMEGDLADLPALLEVCRTYGARFMVDDAHGIGVTGRGRGTAAHFGLADEVDLIMSTFSKSLASLGGFVAGDEDVISYIKHHARALIFSASPTPANTASALAALHVLEEEPELVDRVIANGDYMRTGLRELGFNIGNSVTPIVPILVGDDQTTFAAWRMLFDNGVFVNPVISPAVSPGRQMLRTSYMATHTTEQLDRVLDITGRIGKKLGLI
ncbi:MAG: aminotransferase class I/II-fold pyridoxal phosphate-dependent enzyme [Actinobacteria bacterium]|nr:aminotransferase class I/II-fold pyridoxal phosphate-dependent enzyme [Actinomycetota bacterium]